VRVVGALEEAPMAGALKEVEELSKEEELAAR